MTSTPPVREMIRQAIEGLGGRATTSQIRDAVLARYSGTNPSTINTQLNFWTVNSPSRIHCPENARPRRASDPRFDFLYRIDRGLVELYDPARHGVWEIVKGADGRLRVAIAGEAPPAEPGRDAAEDEVREAESAQAETVFALEQHLRAFLVANLGTLDIAGSPLSVFNDKLGQRGVEYRTDVGPIDILAVDANGDFVIFELKLGRGPDSTVGQLARYLGWVKHNLAGERAVRGVIVARTVDEKLRYAASVIPNVSLFEYRMSFTLQPADEVGVV